MQSKITQEILKCKHDFPRFCRYLKIIDKDGRLSTLKLNKAQKLIFDKIDHEKWVCILKARQLGSSTIIAAYFFWKTLFNVNERTIVVAHTTEAVKNIFRIYKTFYENLPTFLQFQTIASSVNELAFVTGSFIKVGSASSESFRGSTYRNIHASETAFWKNIPLTIASLFQTAADNSTIVIETTANGINDFQKFWLDDNGFAKQFIGWKQGEDYATKKAPKTINQTIITYGAEQNLTKQQLYWASNTFDIKCASNIKIFHQEYPATAMLAFLASGDRVFQDSFDMQPTETGLKLYAKPLKYGLYTIGIDTASGSKVGDYSAFCVLDCSDKRRPAIVATFYERVPPKRFADIALRVAKKYGALAVVESNSYGLSVIEHLVEQEYGLMYRRTKYDKMGNRWNEQLGFSTNVATRPLLISRLQEYIHKNWLYPLDKRLQNEMNTFVYNKSGKPIADSGKHDDMIFAVGLALMGLDQMAEIKTMKENIKPANIPEMLELEVKTGKLYKNISHNFKDPIGALEKDDTELKDLLYK